MSSSTPASSGSAVTRAELAALVTEIVADYARELQGHPVEVGDATVLAGPDGLFDSMGLVTVVLEVEQRLSDRVGRAVTLVDERAMSQQRSPFRSVASLVEYLTPIVAEPRTSDG